MDRIRSGEDARKDDRLVEDVLPGESATARAAHASLRERGGAWRGCGRFSVQPHRGGRLC